MGCYINPPNESKEEFLNKNGLPLAGPPTNFDSIAEDFLPVVLVDNGPFTAAGVAYDKREFEAFTAPDDRPTRWFLVTKADLREVSPLDFYLK